MNKNKLTDHDTFTQISTTPAFTEGIMDTNYKLSEVKKLGNFGFGGTAGIEQGYILLDDVIYTFPNSDEQQTVCLSLITNFTDNESVQNINKSFNLKDLRNYIENLLPTKNIIYAIKIHGNFDFLTTTETLSFSKPYPKLTPELVNNSINKTEYYISGTLVCFWLPDYLKGINGGAGGLHIHFISSDKKFLGHVLDCNLQKGVIHINRKHKLNLILPKTDEFYNVDLNDDKEKLSTRVEEFIKFGIGGK